MKLYNIITLTSALLCAQPVFASLYPVITSIQTTILSPIAATYTITQELVDIGPAGDEPVSGIVTFGLAHRHDNFIGGQDTATLEQGYISIRSGDNYTWSTLGVKAYEVQKSITDVFHGGAGNGGECVSYIGSPVIGGPWRNTRSPVPCVYAPPGKDWCKLLTPSITFSHGSISLKAATEINTQVKPVEIECTAPMTVHVNFGRDVLELATGVTSTLSVQNKPNALLDAPSGVSTINIESTLFVDTNAKTGELSASTFIVLDYL